MTILFLNYCINDNKKKKLLVMTILFVNYGISVFHLLESPLSILSCNP